MHNMITPDTLAPRFLAPPQWQWRTLACGDYDLRYGFAMPEASACKGVIVALQGLSEFAEKYFETAQEALSRGYGFLALDWRGQGGSTRYLDNPHKRHSQGLDADAHDLKKALDDCPALGADTPLFMVAHSMGGQIGIRFLDLYPKLFKAAGFTAPLMGLHAFQKTGNMIGTSATTFLSSLSGTSYAPMGGDWLPDTRDLTSHLVFSQDTERGAVHNAWMRANKTLQVGHVTNQWLKDAHQSCLYTQNIMALEAIDTPCLFTVAEHETLVDNTKTKLVSARLPHSSFYEIPTARHEILMEKDSVRSVFIDKFYSLLNTVAID